MEATDSVGANIAEGFGRYHKKDKIKFFYNARGSLYEAIHWAQLAQERFLLEDKLYHTIIYKLEELPREINYLIKITNDKLTI